MVKTAILVSGGGTNLQAILDADTFGEIKNCELAAVISSSPEAYALTRAKYAQIPTYVIDEAMFPNSRIYTDAICDKLKDLDIELVVMAGFVYNLGSRIVKMYENRIITTYPSLLPAFCTDEWMTMKVYEDTINYGAKISGATAMFMGEEPGHGAVIMQKAVDVLEDDTAKTLQQRIMEKAEWELLPKAISLYCEGRLEIADGIVKIIPEAEAAQQVN